MKQVLYTIAIALTLSITVNAQYNKGLRYIGGQMNFYGNTNNILDTLRSENAKTQTCMLVPQIGYYISNTISLGINIKFGIADSELKQLYSSYTPTKIDKYSYHTLSYGLGSFVRKNFEIHEKFSFFAQGEINYMFQLQKFNQWTSDTAHIYTTQNPSYQESITHIINISVSPGFIYQITPKLGIQTSIGNIHYNNSTISNRSLMFDNHNKTTDYGVSINMESFYLGMAYYF